MLTLPRPCVDTSSLHFLVGTYCLHVSTLHLTSVDSWSNFVLCSHVSTPQYHMSTSDHSFSKVLPLSICVDTLMPCVDTFISIFSTIFMCQLFKFDMSTLHFQVVHYLHVSTLKTWCANTSFSDCPLSSCVNSSNSMCRHFIFRLKSTVFMCQHMMCRHHMIMCLNFLPWKFIFAILYQFFFIELLI